MANEPMTDDEIEYDVYAQREYDDLLRRHLLLHRNFRILAEDRHNLAIRIERGTDDHLHSGTFGECQGPICQVHRAILADAISSIDELRATIVGVVLGCQGDARLPF